MPVPGRPRNPLGQTPTRLRERTHVFVERPGESPGLQDIENRNHQAAGTIRRLWKQEVNFIAAPPPVQVTMSPAIITRALRYKASTVFRAAGTSRTREGIPRAIVPKRNNQPRVTRSAGNQQGRPTVRNRMTSFGSRVPVANQPSPAAVRTHNQ